MYAIIIYTNKHSKHGRVGNRDHTLILRTNNLRTYILKYDINLYYTNVLIFLDLIIRRNYISYKYELHFTSSEFMH